MSGIFESYEQQFATITADITTRITKIPSLVGTEKKTAIGVVQGNVDEAGELLDQMDLEIHDVPRDVREQYKKRLVNYKKELERLKKEFRQAQVAVGGPSMRTELFAENMQTSEDHRARLLDGTAKLETMSDRLEQGQQIAQETEQIGLDIMDNLQRDRETIQRARSRLRDTDADITKGSRIVRRIRRRIIQHKIFFIVGAIVILLIIALVIFAIIMIKTNQG